VTVPTVHDGGAGSAEAGRSVLGRALAVLDTFSNERPEQTLGAICAATGLPSATTHRLANELAAWGALERVGRGRTRGWRYPPTAVAHHVRVGYRRPT
jgi:DNA-binding IclR family transcriptional regulator